MPDNMSYSLGLVIEPVIGIKKFAQDMDRISNRNWHQKNRYHGTHDMDIKTKANQEPHRANNADYSHQHRSNNKKDALKKD
jgi:hypothetical protein